MKTFTLVMALVSLSAPALADLRHPGRHFIESWDVDGDGAVSVEDIEVRRGDIFYMFDADENGVLDAAEYAQFDETRENDIEANAGDGQGGILRRAARGMTLAFNDTDGNGEVTREEFLAHSDDWMTLLDRDSDGHVTSADFGHK